MESSTGQKSTKRVRIATEAEVIHPENMPPLEIAISVIKTGLASLHGQFRDTLVKLGSEYVRIQAKIIQKKHRISKLENDTDYIPKSARCEFALTCIKQVKHDSKFIALQEKVNESINNFHSTLRGHIIESQKIELEVLYQECRKKFVKNIRTLTMNYLVLNRLDKTNTDELFVSLLHKYSLLMLIHLNTNTQSIIELYKEENSLKDLPEPMEISTQLSQPSLSQSTTEKQQNSVARVPLTLDKKRQASELKDLIEKVFLRPVHNYVHTFNEKLIKQDLIALNKEIEASSATEETQQEIDKEKTVDPETLKKLIHDETSKRTAKLQEELRRMSQQVSHLKKQKNSSGATKNEKEKNGGAGKKKSSPRTKRNENQDGKGNVSRKGNNGKNRSKKTSGRNDRKSVSQRNTLSKTSNKK